MYRSPNSSIFQKQNRNQISLSHHEELSLTGEPAFRYGYQIHDLERKMESFGGMDQAEEDIINELARAGQRLDALTSKVRGFLKLQPLTKDKKYSSFVSYSPSRVEPKSRQPLTKHTTSQIKNPQPKAMRLKDRVQKALEEQDRNTNIQRQPKYIK